ncbi:ShK domain-like protein [Nitzschia inconspicua]|uniref:ShK domain-like protein n=1 Tax=Nitzschia inconspicua TaxID=303405 RepID=A0A9K3PJ19_9STRA|nr:ShK domain-like protein [Nitzschia inconspicua]
MIHAEIDVQTGLECVDRDDKCPLMATMGECKTNRSYTNEHCRKSCDRCRVMRVNSSEEMQRIMQQKKEELMKQRRERKEAQRILEKGFEL